VAHLLWHVNECFNGQLADLSVEKDIKFIEDAERSLETFAECPEQAYCGVTSLSSTVVKNEKETCEMTSQSYRGRYSWVCVRTSRPGHPSSINHCSRCPYAVFVGRGFRQRHHGRGDAGGGTTCLHIIAGLSFPFLAKASVAGEKQDRVGNSSPVVSDMLSKAVR
jgi:hypothetical protein